MPDQTTGPATPGPLPEGPAAPDRSTAEQPDQVAAACTYMVGAIAAVVSFSGWSGLAHMAGFSGQATVPLTDHTDVTVQMAWLFSLLVDAYAIGATRVWLQPRTASVETQTYAKWSALGATALTIVGNAVYHGLVVAGPLTGFWYVTLAVLVGAIAPVMLGLSLHLRSMCSKDAKAAADRAAEPLTAPVRERQSVKPDRAAKPKKPVRSTAADDPVRALPTDQADLDRITQHHPDRVPSKRAIRSLLGCGAEKSKRLHQLLTQESEVTT